jgi:hypothetical protein
MRKTIKINEKNYEVSISEKNSKMGNIPSFSVPSGTDYYCNQDCKGCYAKKGETFRECIKSANMDNYIFLEELKKVKHSLCNIATNKRIYSNVLNTFGRMVNSLNCRIFRFNVYGDADDFYFKFILNICNNFWCKDVKFYVYTKNYNIVSSHINDILVTKNLIVNVSIMHYKYTYLLNRFKGIDNINFFYTFKNEEEASVLENSYNINLHKCLNDCDKSIKCVECGHCFNYGYTVCNEYRHIKTRKIVRYDSDRSNKLDYYYNIFTNVNNDFVKNVLLYVTETFYNFIDSDLTTLDLLVNNFDEVESIIKKQDTFYLGCCKVLLYIYNNVSSEDAVKFAYDVINYTIFDIYNTNRDIRLLDSNIHELYKDIHNLCQEEIEKTQDTEFFNKATFSISNKVCNALVTRSKYAKYYNIRRIVFSQCNLICNWHISTKLD